MKSYPYYIQYKNGEVAKVSTEASILLVTIADEVCTVNLLQGGEFVYALTADVETVEITAEQFNKAFGKAMSQFTKANAVV